MNLFDILIPNFDMFFIIFGVLFLIGLSLIFLSSQIPLRKIRNKISLVGWMVAIGSIVGWFSVSFIVDMFSNIKTGSIFVSVVVLILSAIIIFRK